MTHTVCERKRKPDGMTTLHSSPVISSEWKMFLNKLVFFMNRYMYFLRSESDRTIQKKKAFWRVALNLDCQHNKAPLFLSHHKNISTVQLWVTWEALPASMFWSHATKQLCTVWWRVFCWYGITSQLYYTLRNQQSQLIIKLNEILRSKHGLSLYSTFSKHL